MRIAAIDFETQGVDPKLDRPTEVAVCVFNTEDPVYAEDYSFLIWDKMYPPQSPEIVEITKITDEMLQTYGISPEEVVADLFALVAGENIDAFVAHNAEFDRAVFNHLLVTTQADSQTVALLHSVPWICTWKDVEHPARQKCFKLSHLALDYGVAVDPSKLHRALDDVKLMVEMLGVIKPDWTKLLARSQEPAITVRALVPKPFGPQGDGGKGKDAARAAGFQWSGNMWTKTIKESERGKTEEKLGYKISEI